MAVSRSIAVRMNFRLRLESKWHNAAVSVSHATAVPRDMVTRHFLVARHAHVPNLTSRRQSATLPSNGRKPKNHGGNRPRWDDGWRLHSGTDSRQRGRTPARALSEENYLLAQTNILHLATIDFSRFIRIGLSEYTPFHEFRVFL